MEEPFGVSGCAFWRCARTATGVADPESAPAAVEVRQPDGEVSAPTNRCASNEGQRL